MRIQNRFVIMVVCILLLPSGVVMGSMVVKPGPSTLPCFDLYEVVLQLDPLATLNPFTDIEVKGTFTPRNQSPIPVQGFCDDQDGHIFRVRFCPFLADTEYTFTIQTSISPEDKYAGSFRTTKPIGMEPVVINPKNPHHFQFAGSQQPFYHLGLTAYHLLDPSNTDLQIDELLDYCVQHGFNKVRFLLTGYPRDPDGVRGDQDPSEEDLSKLPNYGAPAGELNPLPAWLGKPHQFDFQRFNVSYWQRVDRTVRAMRDRGIVATCILTIEKQDLPNEYGALTEHEKRLYRFAVARLSAFSNVWWDLGNEHNEYRKPDWAPQMGGLMKAWDPYDRLCSAHGYDEWKYGNQPWADFIITQQYGNCEEVNSWALQYRQIPKPYVNEEYGYEGKLDKPGHSQNSDWVRKCHWSIAMAGGYATYGDWTSDTVFYTGHVGGGQAPAQLHYLRTLFESLPYPLMQPQNELVRKGAFCLARPGEVYLVYIPDGKETFLNTQSVPNGYTVTWIDPRTGKHSKSDKQAGGTLPLQPLSSDDWAVIIQVVQVQGK
jgi:hypothetical protein